MSKQNSRDQERQGITLRAEGGQIRSLGLRAILDRERTLEGVESTILLRQVSSIGSYYCFLKFKKKYIHITI